MVRCPECEAPVDLDPLMIAHDLAIVSALLQELGIEKHPPPRVKEFLDKLARRSVTLCTDLGHYGYDALADPKEANE